MDSDAVTKALDRSHELVTDGLTALKLCRTP